jgi:hypothetical protein
MYTKEPQWTKAVGQKEITGFVKLDFRQVRYHFSLLVPITNKAAVLDIPLMMEIHTKCNGFIGLPVKCTRAHSLEFCDSIVSSPPLPPSRSVIQPFILEW